MMKQDVRIVTVDEKNISDHPQAICFINPKHETYSIKIDWFKKRFKEGLKIKLLYLREEKRPVGFMEYVPGKHAWRAVSAKGYMFIHCIWVHLNRNKNKGIGTRLLEDCFNDAKKSGCVGVATITSSGPFMANKNLFVKNGFKVVESVAPTYDLLAKPIKKGRLPKFNNGRSKLSKYKGLHIIYSRQCPWVARFVSELKIKAKQKGLKLVISELKTPSQAQQAPSPYATFNLVHNGKLLADHYISETRFMNILKKERLL